MADWHPILVTTEPGPGAWLMVDLGGNRYAPIHIRSNGAGVHRLKSFPFRTRMLGERVVRRPDR